MNKRFYFALTLLILLLGGAFYMVYFQASFFISRILSEKLDVKAKVEKVQLKKSEIILNGIKIKNPKGSEIRNAFKANQVSIKASYLNLVTNPILIDQILMEDVYVSLILSRDNSSACNWNKLLSKMSNDKPSWYSIQRTAVIKDLTLKNITIAIQLFGKPPQKLSPVKVIHFDHIDVQKGIPTKTISKIIVSKMMSSIFSLSSLKSLIGLPLDALDFMIKPFEKSDSKKGDSPCPMYD